MKLNFWSEFDTRNRRKVGLYYTITAFRLSLYFIIPNSQFCTQYSVFSILYSLFYNPYSQTVYIDNVHNIPTIC